MHVRNLICTFASQMDIDSFTSGPVRPLNSQELGVNRLTDYELLSDSGHNLVYRAQMGGKWVVLKAAKTTEGELTRNQLLLEREFEIMHRLDSIYVVQTISIVDDPQLGRAILMEYIHGRPLDKFVAENPSSTERRRVADELMEALIFLHDRQIVHGDLKPSNILITDSGNHVRLIDFGFADNDAYIAKNIGSSPSISAPESLPHDALTPQRDIYALGKMLALLFPHSAKPVIRRCLSPNPCSVHQVRTALHRLWLLRWMLPLLLAFASVIALVIVFFPRPAEPLPPTIVTRTDTVVVITRQPVDSVWLRTRNEVDNQYTSLYRAYADSLTAMPEKTMNAAVPLLSNYGNRMLEKHNRLTKIYPQYEDSLQELYLLHLVRDHNRLRNIYEDYPIIYSDSK